MSKTIEQKKELERSVEAEELGSDDGWGALMEEQERLAEERKWLDEELDKCFEEREKLDFSKKKELAEIAPLVVLIMIGCLILISGNLDLGFAAFLGALMFQGMLFKPERYVAQVGVAVVGLFLAFDFGSDGFSWRVLGYVVWAGLLLKWNSFWLNKKKSEELRRRRWKALIKKSEENYLGLRELYKMVAAQKSSD